MGRHLPVGSPRTLLFLSVLVTASALPSVQVEPGPEFDLLFEGPPADSEERAHKHRQPLAADLIDILEATRAKIEELSEATARVVELKRASALRDQPERSAELAHARSAELTAELEAARPESIRLEETLFHPRRRYQQLNLTVSSALTDREAAMDAGEETRAENAKAVDRSGGEAKRLRTDLAAAKEQLSQAIAAVIKMDRARKMASNEAKMLRGEAERARQELSVAHAEIRRLKTANAKLEKQVVSLQVEVRSGTEPTRQTQKLPDLPDVAGSGGASPPRKPQVMSDPVEDEALAAVAPSLATTQPPAPERAPETGSGQPTLNSPELPMVSPERARLETGSGLADFHASIEALNGLERGGTGIDLFSGIEAVSGRAVDIKATLSWDALPPIAKETYLDTLLDDWVAARGGNGAAVVRIVDRSGRVLIEKSSP